MHVPSQCHGQHTQGAALERRAHIRQGLPAEKVPARHETRRTIGGQIVPDTVPEDGVDAADVSFSAPAVRPRYDASAMSAAGSADV